MLGIRENNTCIKQKKLMLVVQVTYTSVYVRILKYVSLIAMLRSQAKTACELTYEENSSHPHLITH